MLTGYMRSKSTPGHMAKLLAIMSKYEGIDFIYLRPEDVYPAQNKVLGKMLVNKRWKTVERELQGFIDINPNYFNKKEHNDLIRYLKANTILSSDKRMPLPKNMLETYFKDNEEISQYLIPSQNIESIMDIESFMKKYKTVVLKPVLSNKGRNVYVLTEDDSRFLLGINKKEEYLSKSDLKKFYNKEIKDKNFIVQKYISSRDTQGHPFDCRIHVEKNGTGKWRNVKNFVRIGIGQKVISNVNQGGGIVAPKTFLPTVYGERWESIYKEIKNLANLLPYHVEKVLDKKYMCFGFDVGIDKDGSLYLFEINDFPIVSPMKSEIAMARAGYYRYVLEGN